MHIKENPGGVLQRGRHGPQVDSQLSSGEDEQYLAQACWGVAN